MEQLTHYKKLRDPNYFGAYEMIYNADEQGKALWNEKVLTIVKVVREEVKTQKAGEEMVVYFMEAKPMILNAINSKNMAKAVGSDLIENWAGKKVVAYVEYINNRLAKEWQYVARIRPEAPVKSLPVLTPTSKNWEKIKLSFNAGNCTLDQIKTTYTLTEENIKLLSNE